MIIFKSLFPSAESFSIWSYFISPDSKILSAFMMLLHFLVM